MQRYRTASSALPNTEKSWPFVLGKNYRATEGSPLQITTTTGESATNGSPVKHCSDCSSAIHPLRLMRHPHTDLCARCQEQSGDVDKVFDPSTHRSVYVVREMERFGAIDPDEDRAGKIQPFVALTWNDLREPQDDTGTARNTGLYVKHVPRTENNHAS